MPETTVRAPAPPVAPTPAAAAPPATPPPGGKDPPPKPPEPGAAKEGDAATAADEAGEGKHMLAVRAREKKLVERQAQHAREREEWERTRTATEAQFTSLRELEKMAKEDPIGFLKKTAAWDEAAIARRLLNDGKPAPEEQTTAMARKLAELEEKLTAKEKAEKDAAAAAEKGKAKDAVVAAFHAAAKAGAEAWPRAAALSDARRERMGLAIATEAHGQGVVLKDPEILDRLEAELAEMGVQVQTPVKASPGSKDAKAPAESSGKDTPPAPTLTSRGAGEVASDDLESMDPLKLTPAQTRELTRRRLDRIKQGGAPAPVK